MKREKVIQVRVSEEELLVIGGRAKAVGVTVVEYLRERGLREEPSVPAVPEDSVGLSEEALGEMDAKRGSLSREAYLQSLWEKKVVGPPRLSSVAPHPILSQERVEDRKKRLVTANPLPSGMCKKCQRYERFCACAEG